MLWLCISLPQWPLQALHVEDAQVATVVTTVEGSTRWVICCNDAAERAHLRAPMNYAVAMAVNPNFVAMERRTSNECSALERLAAWAYQFSSTVILRGISPDFREAHRTALWLEIGSSLKLFGGLRRLIEQLEQELQHLGYTYRLGIAPTLEGAALLANAGIRVAITTLPALHARIRNLPLTKLFIDLEASRQLQTVGIRTIGSLLDLPRDALAKRFGPQMNDFLDRLLGLAADPRPTFRLPSTYCSCCEFDFEIRNSEALLFSLRRMLREFSGFLRARDTAVQHFELRLLHRESSQTVLPVGLSVADRDATRLFTLTRERLESTPLPAPVIALTLAADQFVEPTALQANLMNRTVQQNEDIAHTVDRLKARLGPECVHGLKQLADHRPEKSWGSAELGQSTASLRFPSRPLWLLPEPLPMKSAAWPFSSGAERIESGWWEGGDAQRDYFIVRTAGGADLWVFNDLADGSWHLHGFWS